MKQKTVLLCCLAAGLVIISIGQYYVAKNPRKNEVLNQEFIKHPPPSSHSIQTNDQHVTSFTQKAKAASVYEVAEYHEAIYQDISRNEDYPILKERIAEMQARRPEKNYQVDDVVSAIKDSAAWTELEEAPDAMPLTDEEKTDGRVFVAFNALKIETLMPGDELDLPFLETGEDLVMIIDSVFHHDNGALTWHGHLQGRDDKQIQITQSEKLTLADIDTPAGSFILQAHDNVGWLASHETLDKRDYFEDDVLIPNDHE